MQFLVDGRRYFVALLDGHDDLGPSHRKSLLFVLQPSGTRRELRKRVYLHPFVIDFCNLVNVLDTQKRDG